MSLTWRILTGDVRETLKTLPDQCVQTVVTSPPYWGLRDYGTEGQLGLEATPEAYTATMVRVFAEVRRVLADDGTVWLNLGSSYAGGGGFYETAPSTATSKSGKYGSRGALIKGRIPGGVSGGSDPIPSRQQQRVPSYGSDGTEPSDSQAIDSSYFGLCDGCLSVLRSDRSENNRQQPLQEPLRVSQTDRDNERLGCAAASLDASLPYAQASTTTQSSEPLRVWCSHCANCGACLSVLRSSSRDASLCVRKAARIGGSGDHDTDGRTSGTDVSGMAWLNYTFKPKDMVPIPWMVAMALQQDGWFLRCDVIWSKPNPMPESVTDRPTKAHEYIFLLSKSPRYYYDAAAIAEGFADERQGNPGAYKWSYANAGGQGGVRGSGGDTKIQAEGWNADGGKAGRNKRSVWHVATQPYPDAHFATYPEKLIEPCILAGTSEKGQCPQCGKPWVRVVELVGAKKNSDYAMESRSAMQGGGKASTTLNGVPARAVTLGWEPSCACDAGEPIPQTVLDPFCGSGTTGAVAIRHGRNFIGCELNPEYVKLAEKRIGSVAPLFAERTA